MEPAQRVQRDASAVPDDREPLQVSCCAGKASLSPLATATILDNQVSVFDGDADTVAA